MVCKVRQTNFEAYDEEILNEILEEFCSDEKKRIVQVERGEWGELSPYGKRHYAKVKYEVVKSDA